MILELNEGSTFLNHNASVGQPRFEERLVYRGCTVEASNVNASLSQRALYRFPSCCWDKMLREKAAQGRKGYAQFTLLGYSPVMRGSHRGRSSDSWSRHSHSQEQKGTNAPMLSSYLALGQCPLFIRSSGHPAPGMLRCTLDFQSQDLCRCVHRPA